MKKILFLISFLSISLLENAQSPAFQWAKNFGGSSNDYGQSIAVDGSGNVYTVGTFSGTADFDPSIGTYTLTSNGVDDIFISKMDAQGNFIWAKKIGGALQDYCYSIAIDASNNIYTTGMFQGTVDFDPSAGTYTLISAGDKDIFVVKFSGAGNLIWAKNMGGSSIEFVYSIDIDASNNVYTTGWFTNTADFDPGLPSYTLTATGATDVFISKLDALGNFVWAKQMFGGLISQGNAVKVDLSGNIYTTGWFQGTMDFDPGIGTYTLSANVGNDVFISKLDNSGNFVWAKNIDGASNNTGTSIEVDAVGNSYITGYFNGTVDFDPGSSVFNLTAAAATNYVFILKLDINGGFVLAKQLGSGSGYGIVSDPLGNIYTAGYFNAVSDFDPGPGTFTLTPNGNSSDIFISKLDASGNFIWAKQAGGVSGDGASSIFIDGSNNLYLTGSFNGIVDFDPDAPVYNLTSEGGYDAFILKMSSSVIGIKENTSRNNILIFPNPTNDILNIELENSDKVKIEIANTLGQIVFEEMTETKNLKLDIKNLNTGLYFLKILSDDKIIGTQKIIKE